MVRLNIRGGEMATVLLVDDDVGLLGTLGLLIAAEGHLVRTATNGRDALRLALESRPDIVVTDCAMPRFVYPAAPYSKSMPLPRWLVVT